MGVCTGACGREGPKWGTGAPDIWSFGVFSHQLMHGGATPHEKFVKAGKLRLMLSIFDEKSMDPGRQADWVKDGRMFSCFLPISCG